MRTSDEAESEAKRLARPDEQRSEPCALRASKTRVGDETTRGEQCSKPHAMRMSKAESFRDEAKPSEECSEPCCAMWASEDKSEAKRGG